jgi:hypothetical protein
LWPPGELRRFATESSVEVGVFFASGSAGRASGRRPSRAENTTRRGTPVHRRALQKRFGKIHPACVLRLPPWALAAAGFGPAGRTGPSLEPLPPATSRHRFRRGPFLVQPREGPGTGPREAMPFRDSRLPSPASPFPWLPSPGPGRPCGALNGRTGHVSRGHRRPGGARTPGPSGGSVRGGAEAGRARGPRGEP